MGEGVRRDVVMPAELGNFRAYRKKPIVISAALNEGDPFEVKTLEGTMTCDTGDYLIIGVEGEKYPCKPSVFAATYEEVE